MKKIFSTTLFLVLSATLCVGLVSCSGDFTNDILSDTETTREDVTTTEMPPALDHVDRNDTDSMDYSIIERLGKNYIVFDNISAHHTDGQNELATLEFEDLAEFKDCVTKGQLSDWQKTVIATAFKKDEVGVLTCDFNKLLEPHMPSDFAIDGVSWSGESYSFYISTSSDVWGVAHNYTQTQYHDIFQSEFENYFNKTTITVKETIETDEGKNVTTYSTAAGELMQVRYTLSIGNRTVMVDETYRLNMANDSITTSASIPTNITLYCVGNGAYYVVDLFGFTEKPLDSWLCEFSMEPYVERDVVVE